MVLPTESRKRRHDPCDVRICTRLGAEEMDNDTDNGED